MQDGKTRHVRTHDGERHAFVCVPEVMIVLLDKGINLICGPHVIRGAEFPRYFSPTQMRIHEHLRHLLAVAIHTVDLVYDCH